LEEWFQGSGKEGVIYFSLGTFLKSMGESDKEKFVKAFGKLKQRVLWKYDGEPIAGLSPNVKLTPWTPQQDVLGSSCLHSEKVLFST
jgi:glucuronosyltransferase